MMMPVTHETVRVAIPKTSVGSVLLIEDDEYLARSLVRMLTAEGYQVVHVTNGPSAVEKVMQRSFDAVVSDVHLPTGSGVDVLNVVRAYDPEVPLVLMTGTPSAETEREAVSLGVLEYLVKPTPKEQLVNVLTRAKDRRRASNARREAEIRDRVAATRERVVLSVAPTVRPPSFEVSAQALRPTMPEMASVIVPSAKADSAKAEPRTTLRCESGTCKSTKQAIERALETLSVELEPVVDAVTKKVMGFCSRMHSSEIGLTTDAALVAAAEAVGRLPELRRRARDLAITAFAAAPTDAMLFVDIHPIELIDSDLYAPKPEVAALAERIVLQIRGTGLDTTDLGARASVLRFVGFRLAITDLDAAHSPAQLAELSPEFVKIDARLVRGVNNSTSRRRIVKALVAMARALDAVAIGDGVSTAEERDTLVDAGCSFVQGSLVVHRARSTHRPDLAKTFSISVAAH